MITKLYSIFLMLILIKKPFGSLLTEEETRKIKGSIKLQTAFIDEGFNLVNNFIYRGLNYLKLGLTEEAENDFKYAARQRSKNANELYKLAEAFRLVDNLTEARRHYNKVLEIDPYDHKSHKWTSRAKKALKEIGEVESTNKSLMIEWPYKY